MLSLNVTFQVAVTLFADAYIVFSRIRILLSLKLYDPIWINLVY